MFYIMLFQVNSLQILLMTANMVFLTSDTSAEEAAGPSSEYELPKSLQTILKSNWADPMDDIAYIHSCSLEKSAAPKFTTLEAKLLHQQHTIQFISLA